MADFLMPAEPARSAGRVKITFCWPGAADELASCWAGLVLCVQRFVDRVRMRLTRRFAPGPCRTGGVLFHA